SATANAGARPPSSGSYSNRNVSYTAPSLPPPSPAIGFLPWCNLPPTTMNLGNSPGPGPLDASFLADSPGDGVVSELVDLGARKRATIEPVQGRALPEASIPPRLSDPAIEPVRPIVPATPWSLDAQYIDRIIAYLCA